MEHIPTLFSDSLPCDISFALNIVLAHLQIPGGILPNCNVLCQKRHCCGTLWSLTNVGSFVVYKLSGTVYTLRCFTFQTSSLRVPMAVSCCRGLCWSCMLMCMVAKFAAVGVTTRLGTLSQTGSSIMLLSVTISIGQ